MNPLKPVPALLAAAVLAIGLAAPAFAQTSISSSDIQRLQDQVYEANSDISRLRGSSGDQASRLQGELDDLRDEVIYLKVKMRKEGSVSRADYSDVRDRLQDLRTRAARGDNASNRQGTWNGGGYGSGSGSSSSAGTGSSGGGTYTPGSGGVSGGVVGDERRTQSGNGIPAGQEVDVRLQDELNSDTAQVEQRFEATTMVDLYRGERVLIPAGSTMRGVVSSVNKATRTDRKGSLTVAFDQVTINGRAYPIRGSVTQALESEGIKGEIGKIGTGGAIGGILGGILGGTKGALLGVVIGGGGVVAATEGKDVKLPSGTVLRVRLDQPPAIK